jgi:hypothetical protein
MSTLAKEEQVNGKSPVDNEFCSAISGFENVTFWRLGLR